TETRTHGLTLVPATARQQSKAREFCRQVLECAAPDCTSHASLMTSGSELKSSVRSAMITRPKISQAPQERHGYCRFCGFLAGGGRGWDHAAPAELAGDCGGRSTNLALF